MFLETVTGRLVNVINPSPDQIDIEDIAWGLSRISRFCGSTITEVPYNVAQHSNFVADEIFCILSYPENYPDLASYVDEIVELASKPVDFHMTIVFGQIHDGSEVYTGDLPSPIKQIPELRPVIKKIESNLMSAIYKAFNLPEPTELQEIIVKHADKIAQRVEAHAFMPSRGRNWEGLPVVSLEKLQKFKDPMPSLEAYKLFMEKFNYHYNNLLTAILNEQPKEVQK